MLLKDGQHIIVNEKDLITILKILENGGNKNTYIDKQFISKTSESKHIIKCANGGLLYLYGYDYYMKILLDEDVCYDAKKILREYKLNRILKC